MSDNESLHSSDFSCYGDNEPACECCYCDLGPEAGSLSDVDESLESISDAGSEAESEAESEYHPGYSTIPLHPIMERMLPPSITNENRHTYVQTPESVLASVNSWGPSIAYVRDEFITYEVCKVAIKCHSGAICSIKPQLLSQEEYYDLCMESVSDNGWNMKFIPAHVQTQELCDAAVESICWALQYVREEFKNYENCYSAVRRNGGILQHVPLHFIDEAMCVAAAKSRYPCLNFMPPEYLTREMCHMAVSSNGRSISDVPDACMSSELAYIAVTTPEPSDSDGTLAGANIQHIAAKYLTREIILESVKRWSPTYSRIPTECISEEFELEILDVSPWCIRGMSQTPAQCMRAFKANPRVLRESIKRDHITREMAEYALSLPRETKLDFGKDLYQYLESLL
jgi:hypothetical protein